MKRLRILATAALGAGLVLGGMAAAPAMASSTAGSGPVITFWPSPIPVIGSQLGTSVFSSVLLKVGWDITDPAGITSAKAENCDFQGDYCPVAWTYSGSGSATSVSGHWVQWQASDESDNAIVYATDTAGATGNSGYMQFNPNIYDSLGASSSGDNAAPVYSSGWQTSKCSCYSDGHLLYTSTPGATATFQAGRGGGVASFVTDTGPTRGVVGISVNGGAFKNVNLKTGSSTVNRVVVWNSGYLAGSATITVKDISGRVDFEDYITEYP